MLCEPIGSPSYPVLGEIVCGHPIGHGVLPHSLVDSLSAVATHARIAHLNRRFAHRVGIALGRLARLDGM